MFGYNSIITFPQVALRTAIFLGSSNWISLGLKFLTNKHLFLRIINDVEKINPNKIIKINIIFSYFKILIFLIIN